MASDQNGKTQPANGEDRKENSIRSYDYGNPKSRHWLNDSDSHWMSTDGTDHENMYIHATNFSHFFRIHMYSYTYILFEWFAERLFKKESLHKSVRIA